MFLVVYTRIQLLTSDLIAPVPEVQVRVHVSSYYNHCILLCKWILNKIFNIILSFP